MSTRAVVPSAVQSAEFQTPAWVVAPAKVVAGTPLAVPQSMLNSWAVATADTEATAAANNMGRARRSFISLLRVESGRARTWSRTGRVLCLTDYERRGAVDSSGCLTVIEFCPIEPLRSGACDCSRAPRFRNPSRPSAEPDFFRQASLRSAGDRSCG